MVAYFIPLHAIQITSSYVHMPLIYVNIQHNYANMQHVLKIILIVEIFILHVVGICMPLWQGIPI